MKKADTAGVIAPPPVIYLGFLLAGLGVDWALGWTETGLSAFLRFGAAGFLGVLAVYFLLGASARFRQAGTDVRPWAPTTAIVTTGVYRLTRNPMYLGMAMLYAAIALAADSLIALALLIPTVIVIDIGVIRREERYLAAKFGDEYLRYKAAVRRWI